MDRAELLNDQEEAMRLILDGRQATTWTAMPAIVQSVNLTAMTCNVQVSIKAPITDENGVTQLVELPLLLDVPIVFPSAGGFSITFPMVAGDEVLVVWASRCIDAWWQLGDVQLPMEARMNDLSDGFAIPGPKSQPRALSGVDSANLQIRNDDGDTYFQLGADGKMNLVNATTDLKTVLSDLESLLNSFMTTLSGFSGGGSPVTQAMIQAPAATAVTQLGLLLIKIGALLG